MNNDLRRRSRHLALAAGIACAVLAACRNAPAPPEADLVLRGVHVVDIGSGVLRRDQDVVIDAGRVVAIESDSSRRGGSEPVVSGQYLAPAPIDAHVHIYDERDLQMYATHGIRTVRNLDGWPWHLRLREAARGDPGQAALLTAGVQYQFGPFDGADGLTEALVAELHEDYDWIKLYDALDRPALEAVDARIDGSRPVTGHLPDEGSAMAALSVGVFDDIAHAEELHALMTAEFGDWRDGLDAVAQLMLDGDVTLTTALVNNQLIADQVGDFEAAVNRDETALAAPLLQVFWRSEFNPYRSEFSAETAERVQNDVDEMTALAVALHRRGVPLWAGTDAPNPIAAPGESLIREIELLHAAGLSPRDAYAATLPAELGSEPVEAGAAAELVLLREDPLADASALRSLAGAVRDGVYAPQRALLAQRQALTAAYRADAEILKAFHPSGPDAVIRAIEAAPKPRPISREALASLAWFYSKIRNLPAARAVSRTMLDLYPEDAAARRIAEELGAR